MRIPEQLRPQGKDVSANLVAGYAADFIRWVSGEGWRLLVALMSAGGLTWFVNPTSDAEIAKWFLAALLIFTVVIVGLGWAVPRLRASPQPQPDPSAEASKSEQIEKLVRTGPARLTIDRLTPDQMSVPQHAHFSLVGNWLNTPFRMMAHGIDAEGRALYSENLYLRIEARSVIEKVRIEIAIRSLRPRDDEITVWTPDTPFSGTVTPGMSAMFLVFRRTFHFERPVFKGDGCTSHTGLPMRRDLGASVFDGADTRKLAFGDVWAVVASIHNSTYGVITARFNLDLREAQAPLTRVSALNNIDLEAPGLDCPPFPNNTVLF